MCVCVSILGHIKNSFYGSYRTNSLMTVRLNEELPMIVQPSHSQKVNDTTTTQT